MADIPEHYAILPDCTPFITAQSIYFLHLIYVDIGCNHNSLYYHLSEWIRYGYITKRQIDGLYHHLIALKDNSYFKAITQRFLSRRKRK